MINQRLTLIEVVLDTVRRTGLSAFPTQASDGGIGPAVLNVAILRGVNPVDLQAAVAAAMEA
jgi:hypothetical protein